MSFEKANVIFAIIDQSQELWRVGHFILPPACLVSLPPFQGCWQKMWDSDVRVKRLISLAQQSRLKVIHLYSLSCLQVPKRKTNCLQRQSAALQERSPEIREYTSYHGEGTSVPSVAEDTLLTVAHVNLPLPPGGDSVFIVQDSLP